jgi:hypothetical protein
VSIDQKSFTQKNDDTKREIILKGVRILLNEHGHSGYNVQQRVYAITLCTIQCF